MQRKLRLLRRKSRRSKRESKRKSRRSSSDWHRSVRRKRRQLRVQQRPSVFVKWRWLKPKLLEHELRWQRLKRLNASAKSRRIATELR